MVDEYPVERMAGRIRSLKESAVELRNLSGGIEAVNRNVDRILASIKMLEINIVDVADLIPKDQAR
ncbi:hypothetical protein ACFLVC_04825 [Chloroflexota bacterium]